MDPYIQSSTVCIVHKSMHLPKSFVSLYFGSHYWEFHISPNLSVNFVQRNVEKFSTGQVVWNNIMFVLYQAFIYNIPNHPLYRIGIHV